MRQDRRVGRGVEGHRRPGTGMGLAMMAALLPVVVSGVTACTTAGPGEGPAPVGRPVSSTPSSGALLPATLPSDARHWVDTTLASLSLEEALGQLVFQWISGSYASTSSPEFRELEAWVAEDGIGGVAISMGTPLAYAHRLNALQDRARIPLLVTSDFENGGPGMRINHSYALPSLLSQGGGTSFPPTMAFGAIREDAEGFVAEMARITAVEARAVGVHLNFAPVLDVNSNPANPVINTRAFGEDPARVAELGAAYLRGAREGGILTTAKHFPGHGDTDVDSHLNLPAVTADLERLESVDLVPFRRAIQEGVDAVMTAHVAVPAVLGEGGPPATFAPEFLTGLLREEMGFDGLLFTDALRMGAITERYGGGEAAVLALEAGADVILVPEEVGSALRHLHQAVQSGRVTRERVDASVRRILEAKARVGLHENRAVSLEEVGEVVGAGTHLAFADEAAARSIVLVRDPQQRVPVAPGAVSRVLSITYARTDDLVAGRAFDGLAAGYGATLERLRLDDRSPPGEWEAAADRARQAELILLNVYLPPRSGSGSVGVPEVLSGWAAGVAGSGVPLVVTSFGSPYVLSAFPGAQAALVAWGDREVSQEAAARALFGERRIDGVLPTSVPPLHARGDGLVREAVRAPVAQRTDQLDETGILAAGRRPEGGIADQEAWREVEPASVGMSATGLAELDRVIEAAIRDGATPGAALAVGRGDRLVRLRGYGRLGWDPSEPAVDPRTTRYDMASLTKVVGTTSAILLLESRGVVELEAPVVRYLPDWAGEDPRKARVTILDLLLHRSGLAPFRQWFHDRDGKQAFVQAIQDEVLVQEPGALMAYSDIGFMTLGLVVEAVAGRPLDRFLEEELFAPLGMTSTGYLPAEALRPEIAPTEEDPWRGVMVRGMVHDENSWAMGGVSGHAGLFSTALDAARFVAALSAAVQGGRQAGCRVTGSPAGGGGASCAVPVEGAGAPLPPAAAGWTRRWGSESTRALGWDTPSTTGSSAGDYLSTAAFGHTGFTGTSIWVDPELDLWVVLLTNRVHPTRENQRHIPLRRAVHDAAALAVTDRSVTRRGG